MLNAFLQNQHGDWRFAFTSWLKRICCKFWDFGQSFCSAWPGISKKTKEERLRIKPRNDKYISSFQNPPASPTEEKQKGIPYQAMEMTRRKRLRMKPACRKTGLEWEDFSYSSPSSRETGSSSADFQRIQTPWETQAVESLPSFSNLFQEMQWYHMSLPPSFVSQMRRMPAFYNIKASCRIEQRSPSFEIPLLNINVKFCLTEMEATCSWPLSRTRCPIAFSYLLFCSIFLPHLI